MNTNNKTSIPGLKRLFIMTILGAFILAATGCGSGHSGGCGAYGNPKAPNNHTEQIAE